MRKIIELCHEIKHGEETYPGLPAPHICDFWSRDDSANKYEDGSTFQIGKITMVANTGTYLDAPFHRFEEGADLAAIEPDSFAALNAYCLSVAGEDNVIGSEHLAEIPSGTEAVLFFTGWDKHWATDKYADEHPYLSEDCARELVAMGVKLAGIDSINIDNIHHPSRPIHTILLGSGVLIVEHMTRLDELVGKSFEFHAAPAPVVGMGTFPVRAYAIVD